jgi:hypothetical protein
MRTGQGRLTQIFLGPDAAGQIACPADLIPAPGQYLLALAETDRDAPLATPLFAAGTVARGFLAAPPLPETWLPGTPLYLRGPLGKGFSLPPGARRVALAALGETPARLLPLVGPALNQGAAVLLLTDSPPESLPAEVEVMRPAPSALAEAAAWGDYVALDLPREMLHDEGSNVAAAVKPADGQALVSTPLPCGGMADCGACAIHLRRGYLLACEDGPVVELKQLF